MRCLFLAIADEPFKKKLSKSEADNATRHSAARFRVNSLFKRNISLRNIK